MRRDRAMRLALLACSVTALLSAKPLPSPPAGTAPETAASAGSAQAGRATPLPASDRRWTEDARLADEAHARFDYPAAIPLYEKALLKAPRGPATFDVRLRLADAYFWHAVELEDDEQETYLDRCLTTLQVLALESPGSSAVHARIGRTLGQLAIHRGGREKLKLGQRVKEEADRALKLDPDDALANAVLGKWHYELASLSGIERTMGTILFGEIPEGSFETAAEYLRKAVRLDPRQPYFHLMLARSLLKLGLREEARAQLEGMLKLKPLEGPDRGYLEEARKKLAGLDGASLQKQHR